jgi:hypothetical protein
MMYARLLSVLTAVLLFAFTAPASAADECGHPGDGCEIDSDCCSDFCDDTECGCADSGDPCEIDDDCCTGVCATGACADLAPTPTPASVEAPALGSPASPAFALTALALLLAGAALLSRRVLRDS